ncbi:MAG: alkaline phosphatase family protein [Acholeplasmataceae bacterium]|nr:alkaline phosphatase family protein [Acholeplasmataceae bacterium]
MKRLIHVPDYQNSILNVSASILNHYGVTTAYSTLKILDQELKKDYKHVILMVLDGMGINILNHNLSSDSLLRKNLKTTLSSVFPPTTTAATTAILSGLPPISSGHLGWTQYNQIDDSITTVFLNTDYYNPNKVLTHNLQRDSLSYINIVDQIREVNPNLHLEILFPSFKIGGHETFDDELNRLLMITKGSKSFSYCYWTEPDSTIHEAGITGLKTKQIVKALNTSYERFLSEIGENVLVITTADHGLIDVEPILIDDYKDFLDTLRILPSIEPRATTFFVKKDQHELFQTLFNQYFGKDFVLLSKKEILASHLFGYGKPHLMINAFIGDYFSIAINNKMFQFLKTKPFKAHHAGLTKEELEVPLILNK